MRTLLIWIAVACTARADCVSVTGDKILAGDLAKALPAFVTAPAEEVLGFAPIPGLTRIFKPSEIERFRLHFKIPLGTEPFESVCIVSAAAVLTEDAVRAALVAAIRLPIVSLEILDFSRSALPTGRLEFAATGLTQSTLNPPGTAVWHGRLVMDSGRTFPVWVKLSVVVAAKTVVSARDIDKSRILTSEDVVYQNETSFPLTPGVLTSLDDATGRMALRAVFKGKPILRWMVELPREVTQGQMVHVDAICGDAHLVFEAQAQNSGRRGDEITVRNPNGRSFRAKVIDKDKVEVRSPAGV